MISTATQVQTRVLALCDDPNKGAATDAVVLEGFGEALDVMYSAMLGNQCKRLKVVSPEVALAPLATSITPAAAGITDWGELIHIEERTYGSSEKWLPVWERDDLTQRDPTDKLLEFEWRSDAFYFVGATTQRGLRFTYFTTLEQPTDFTGSTGVDGAKTFLSLYTAARVLRRLGNWEDADYYLEQAVGPLRNWNRGVIGGELFRLIEPMVRSRQNVTWARRPFSATRRLNARRGIPYVAAQAGIFGTGSSSTPVQFTTADGSITGTINSTNLTFYLAYPVSRVSDLTVNGAGKTQGASADYVHGANVITFNAGKAPAAGPITCNGYL